MKIKRYTIMFIIGILALPDAVNAHPESGFLPDAVAEMEYRIVLEINPKDIETRNKLGIVLYRKNKLSEAEKEFSEVLKIFSKNFDAHDGMGLVKIKERRYDDAVSWFKRAVAISGEDTMVHYHMGFAYEQMGRFKEAEDSYKMALDKSAILIQRGINKEVESKKKDILHSALQNLYDKKKRVKGEE